MKLLIII